MMGLSCNVNDDETNRNFHGRMVPLKPFLLLVPILTIVCTLGSSILGGSLVYLYFFPEAEPQVLNHTVLLPGVLSHFDATLYDAYNASIGVCIFTILVSFLCIRFLQSVHLSIQLNMPHVPKGLPYFGNVKEFLSQSPWDLMTNWHSICGPVYSFTLLGRNCVSIAHPMYLRTILQTKLRNTAKDVKFAYQPFLSILGRGIVTSDGATWKTQRLSVSSVLRHDVLEVIPGLTLQSIQRLCKHLDEAEREKKAIDLSDGLRHLTLHVIAKLFFSLDAEESDATFAKMYLPIMEESNKRVWHPERKYAFFLPAFWTYIRNVNSLNRYVSTLIRNRWLQRSQDSSSHQDDVLEQVFSFHEKKNGTKQLTESDISQLCDEMKTFVLAGHETSAAMITWALYELIRNTTNNDMLSKVKEEASSIFGTSDLSSMSEKDLPPLDELNKLVLSEAVLKESLRKYSVVPTVVRTVVETTEIGPHTLPPGTTVFICIQGVHHDPEIWKNPNVFDPLRFVHPAPAPEPYTFLPFIEGPRNCLGQYLALLESKIILSMLVHRYTFEFVGGNDDDDDPRHRFMVPVVPKDGCRVKLTRVCR